MSVRKKGLGNNSGLGKRLSALGLTEKHLDEADKAVEKAGPGMPIEVPIDYVQASPHQARQTFDQQALDRLADSIRQYGLVQPLIVQKKADGTYELIAGERRLRAAKQAGLTTVPVLCKSYTPDVAAEVSLIENLQREDLNAMEEAEAYQMLMQKFGLTQEETAAKVGRSRPYVANMLRLLRLPVDIARLLRAGQLSIGQARPLLQLPDVTQQLQAAEHIVKQGLSARQCEALVQRLLQDKEKKESPSGDAYLEALQDRLKIHLGTNVSIRFNRQRKKGKIEIAVASEAEFERLLALLTEEPSATDDTPPSSFTI